MIWNLKDRARNYIYGEVDSVLKNSGILEVLIDDCGMTSDPDDAQFLKILELRDRVERVIGSMGMYYELFSDEETFTDEFERINGILDSANWFIDSRCLGRNGIISESYEDYIPDCLKMGSIVSESLNVRYILNDGDRHSSDKNLNVRLDKICEDREESYE